MTASDFQISEQMPCHRDRPKAPLRFARIAAALLLAASCAAFAEGGGKPELPQPEQTPILISPTAIGDLEYRPGRGLRIGDTGFTLGGYSTVGVSRLEGAHGQIGLDDLDLFVFFDPTPYLHFFSDTAFQHVFDLDDSGGGGTSQAQTSIERLYGELNLSDRANLRVGKFLTPVGLWNQIPAQPLTWTTSRPLVTMRPFDEHVAGGAFWGSLFPTDASLTYEAYGQFFDPLTSTTSISQADKSVGARLDFSTLGGWSIGGSYFAFTRHDEWNQLGGADLFWQHDRWEVSSEVLAGHGDPAGQRIFGCYLQGVVELFAGVHAIARYEYYDPGANHAGIDLYDAGLAWRPFSILILKADYVAANVSSSFASPGFRASFALLF
jgi:hypothetical protein